ncbi:NAD(P)H-dependent oxidoreductase [Mycoplasma simbae]|uniref:NAD(P)H-dependent oxidoreductase n=1 Tax=Mycoplasma simbae TaxID=36744 RepID=UPI000495C520|nr:NAD(P)H-dependent oxidoreductase [Mycoplasma simbae]
MLKKLFIDGSFFTNESSYTTTLMDAFHALDPQAKRINLNESVFAHNHLSQSNFPAYWEQVQAAKLVEELKSVDVLVLSTSLVNLGLPANVKNFIDGIMVPDLTFTYKELTPQGLPKGLLTNLNVIVVASQGSPQFVGGINSPQVEQLRLLFNFMGVKSFNTIEVFGTKVPGMLPTDLKAYAQTRLEEYNKILYSL